MRLARTVYGAGSNRPPLLIAPGLFGQGHNWGMIARRLADSRQVVAVDMRNHGHSPWSDDHSYAAMAGDLAELIGEIGPPCDVLGHSMGGKAAMVLALTRGDLVHRLVVADIAPVRYEQTQMPLIRAMQAIGSDFASRADADAALRPLVPEPQIRSFLLQSLDLRERRWRFNLDVLARAMPQITDFPDLASRFAGPALFLSGGVSRYMLPEYQPRARALFPQAQFVSIPGADHWLHAERPREVEAELRNFLHD